MKKGIALKIEHLSKKYQLGKRKEYLTLREALVDAVKLPHRLITGKISLKKPEFWALKNISFEVKKGEIVGIIGKNGAGKSTLLKILSRVTEPTQGRVMLRGKIASLLEVGTGFHPELTGRENIYLNGAILGMSKKKINRKFREIVEFSGIKIFLDTPVKRYSSGMYVRLAFSIAAHLEPEILLIDEVFSVGDADFQKKSLVRINEMVQKEKRTVLLASHSMEAIKNLCQRTILLENGKIKIMGKPEEVISKYLGGD